MTEHRSPELTPGRAVELDRHLSRSRRVFARRRLDSLVFAEYVTERRAVMGR